MAGAASSISVAIRVRPFTVSHKLRISAHTNLEVREAAQLSHVAEAPVFLGDGSLAATPTSLTKTKGIRSVLRVVDDRCLVFDPEEASTPRRFGANGKRSKDQTFGFDRVFDENATQNDVYEATTRSLLDSVLDGYNATVFAYGATGCGKTHTITGTVQAPGVIFLTMQELFERIAERTDEKVTEISLSYLEIYNETIRDLLDPSSKGLMLREDANQAVSVAGLSSHRPQNVQQVMDMIVRGNEHRTMSPTEANATSSRSHAVLQINVTQKDRNADINEPHTMATLSIIDLAGSERASATKNRGERLLEGANINKSLLALGSCINALCDPKKRNHVPYRNSKLTRLLKFSLGGNCKTVMIVCVSPSSQHFDETQNTLRYANRAKNIQTKVTRNVYNVNRHVKDFVIKIDEQMALINELKQQLKDHETLAFAKFTRSLDKQDSAVREGIARIRKAYEDSAKERMEKLAYMKRLRQLDRRIATISAWLTAFDHVVEEHPALDHEMHKTAQDMLDELETNRHQCRQKLSKNNWERAIDSAFKHAARQAPKAESGLLQEHNLLRERAEREAWQAVAEDESHPDYLQILLHTHFETMAKIRQLKTLEEAEAIPVARAMLSEILTACSTITNHVIKADSSIQPTELFPPSKLGTPKRKRPVLTDSPVRSRRKPPVKKPVAFTPKKKSPSKRGVRWRDDTEQGVLAEFEKTPQQEESSSILEDAPSISSSPSPPKHGRFRAGFLAKHSPPPPTLTALSSDSDHSPLRELVPSMAGNRSSLHIVQNATDSRSSSDNEGMRTAVKRMSLVTAPTSASLNRQRRRSPSPSNENLFTASHARRMVKSEREAEVKSILSPRTAPVVKGSRRTTLGGMAEVRSRSVSGRTSLAKGVWR